MAADARVSFRSVELEETGDGLTIQIVCPHPNSARHSLVKVYRRGRCYATSWANPPPTLGEARAAFKNRKHRRMFLPFNEATGEATRGR